MRRKRPALFFAAAAILAAGLAVPAYWTPPVALAAEELHAFRDSALDGDQVNGNSLLGIYLETRCPTETNRDTCPEINAKSNQVRGTGAVPYPGLDFRMSGGARVFPILEGFFWNRMTVDGGVTGTADDYDIYEVVYDFQHPEQLDPDGWDFMVRYSHLVPGSLPSAVGRGDKITYDTYLGEVSEYWASLHLSVTDRSGLEIPQWYFWRNTGARLNLHDGKDADFILTPVVRDMTVSVEFYELVEGSARDPIAPPAPEIYVRQSGGDFVGKSMTAAGGNVYTYTFPDEYAGQEVEYYIRATRTGMAAGMYSYRPQYYQCILSDRWQCPPPPAGFRATLTSSSAKPLDLALVIDTTGSMADDIENIKAASQLIVNYALESVPDSRVAVAAFRDHPISPWGSPGDYPYRAVLPFSSEQSLITGALRGLVVAGGNDEPEAVYSALIRTANADGLGAWRADAEKVLILASDAPPHEPAEPVTGYTQPQTVDALRTAGAHVFSIAIGGNTAMLQALGLLSSETGGQQFTVADAAGVVAAMQTAVGAAATGAGEHTATASGVVYNAARGADWPLPDSALALQYLDPTLASWVTVGDAAYPGRMTPAANPQTARSDGRYAWELMPGTYRLHVSRPGFATAVSRVVTLPPALTDVSVGLTPTDSAPPTVAYTGVTPGASYTDPVAIQLTAADAGGAGVRTLAYSVDGGPESVTAGITTVVTVTAAGNHTLTYWATDHAGNTSPAAVTFSIGCAAAPGLAWLPPLQAGAPATANAADPLSIRFRWLACGAHVHDDSVALRIRNATTGTLVAGFTKGVGVVIDDGAGEYRQEFLPSRYGIRPGTQLKVMLYFGGRLRGTALVNVQ